MSDTESSYRVAEESSKFDVVAPDGRSIMTCSNAQSASHYADMLTKAYRLGYKTGYRAARIATQN